MHPLKRTLIASALAAALGATSYAAATAEPVAVASQDRDFLVAAHQGNLAEIALGTRATVASCADVPRIGAMLVTDHTRLDAMGMTVAIRNGVTLPLTPNQEQTQTLLRTAPMTGREFDIAWLQAQRQAHIETLQAGANELNYGFAEDVKALAREAEPIIQQHLDMVNAALANC